MNTIQERINNLGFLNTSMIVTDVQKDIINKAIKLITPFDKENASCGIHYFKEKDCDGNEIGEETCDNDKCVKIALKDLKIRVGKYKRIYTDFSHNDGDHESIRSCSVCYRPLNQYLTWVRQEFEHHKDHTITLEDLTNSRNAFDIRVMLEAIPSADERISDYSVYQNKIGNSSPLEDAIKRQICLVIDIVKYAELIIKILSSDLKYAEVMANFKE